MSVPNGIHPLEPTAHLPESRPTPNQRAGAHNQKVRATREPPRPHGPPQQPHSPWHRRAPLPRPTRPNGRRAAIQAALSFCHRSGARAQPHALRLRHADPQPSGWADQRSHPRSRARGPSRFPHPPGSKRNPWRDVALPEGQAPHKLRVHDLLQVHEDRRLGGHSIEAVPPTTQPATGRVRRVVSRESERTAPKGLFSFPTQALASKTLPVVAGTLCRCRGGRMM
jgi:hypothetical protein